MSYQTWLQAVESRLWNTYKMRLNERGINYARMFHAGLGIQEAVALVVAGFGSDN